jgi:Xaa-Pro aminopeptidase
MADENLDVALVTDADSIFYLSGYWVYAGLASAGRPTIFWILRARKPVMITPLMELEMCWSLSAHEETRPWMAGVDGDWMAPLCDVIGQPTVCAIALEAALMPGLIARMIAAEWPGLWTADRAPILGRMRMIKSADEIHVMRQADEVAVSMAAAAVEAIAIGVPKYEVFLAIIAGGTRRAGALLGASDPDKFSSPMIHNLQILHSGYDTCMVHRRSTTRRIAEGDPINLCFCGIIIFRGYWLGFDREFFCGSVPDEQVRLYDVTLRAQSAALAAIRPGTLAEEPHFADDAVYQDAGFAPTYRTGRGTGCSFLEKPELKASDKTMLEPGMTFAVDGGITVPGEFGTRAGDSILVTDTGFECLTSYSKALRVH